MAEPTPEIAAELDTASNANTANVSAPRNEATVAAAQPTVSPAASGEAVGSRTKNAHAGQPTYSKNLLKIMVPVTVTLASQRKPIREIIELGPGSIVKFAKTCDQPLELSVGDQPIATGEVVKVGDKFGLRIGELRPRHSSEWWKKRETTVSDYDFA
jgi:flagellar motor switch protein FliN/FliY